MEPVKPWRAEYAKSSRSSCKSCKTPIEKDRFRLGKMVVATQFDGYMPAWNHATCIFKKANQIKSLDDIEGADLLRWEDQERLKKYVEGGSVGTTSVVVGECAIEVSKTSRATCKRCNEKILKETIRISVQPDGQGPRGLSWHHAKCFSEMSPTLKVENLSSWESLSAQEREQVLKIFKKDPSGKGSTAKALDETEQKIPHKSNKRQKSNVAHESKAPKVGEDASAGIMSRKDGASTDLNPKKDSLQHQLEKQSKALWDIKDELKKHVTVGELRDMLEVNEQDSRGSEYDIRERCADGMLFGALDKCPLCSGSLCYSGGQYRCHGYLSAWSKCTYSTVDDVRLKKKWKIPDKSSNEYLCNWFKSQGTSKHTRILPPSSTRSSVDNANPNLSLLARHEGLESLKVAFSGMLRESLEAWKNKLESFGSAVHPKIKKETNCLVVGEVSESDVEVKKARRMKLPIVRENYLVDCIDRQKKLPFDLYKVESYKETSGSGVVTVKVKGRSAVHEASGLQDTGHILEDDNIIYNTTLNMSDLSTGINSYYILQVIEEDKGRDCYLFRKWGRVGNEKIGGTKLEELERSSAITEFKRLFLDKTGNPWEAWVEKKNFEKKPGRLFPLEIDYGVKKAPKKNLKSENSLLPSQLANLMKMLFNIETYRAAMMEFEINLSEMPLGKLSKINIQKGFEALTEIQNLLNDTEALPSAVKESMIVDASNRFFTLIPSVHPRVIRDESNFKTKVKMLEALQDIEIASRLVGFDCDDDESLDEKYKKLQCEIAPLSHDSEEYKLVKKYLLNTHAPTHKDWSLELQEVFSLERRGETDKYAPYKNKLHNKMLLWHGSRLTNFVGILSQGLRIAPPEAPATGYMFGKGLYFADLVSKSAQYCYVDKKDPVGLLLLSEVALGEMHELKKASYIEKPPKGKHSTKGLGKNVPLESEFVKWKEQVVVPCGKPVPAPIRASELLYNEYIVYNTNQVKMQFLLKVRFHHKS